MVLGLLISELLLHGVLDQLPFPYRDRKCYIAHAAPGAESCAAQKSVARSKHARKWQKSRIEGFITGAIASLRLKSTMRQGKQTNAGLKYRYQDERTVKDRASSLGQKTEKAIGGGEGDGWSGIEWRPGLRSQNVPDRTSKKVGEDTVRCLTPDFPAAGVLSNTRGPRGPKENGTVAIVRVLRVQ